MENENRKPFGKIRGMLFPIYKDELRKFLPLCFLFFNIAGGYTLLRYVKDALALKYGGAEMIAALKLFGVMPSVVLFTILYSTISKSLSRDGRFNAVVGYFASFFTLFLIVLLPNIETWELKSLAASANEAFPQFKGIWALIRSWPVTLFYINAELWGTFSLSVIFWTLANEIINLKQSKRFYTFLSLGAQLAMIIAGVLISTVFKKTGLVVPITTIVVVCGMTLVVYNLFSRAMNSNPAAYQLEATPKKKKKKVKLSLVESFKFLFQSKYLMLVAVLLLGYNMSINLLENVWKDRLKALASVEPGIIAKVYGAQYYSIGILAILLIFCSSLIMRRSWRFATLFTPVVATITSVAFFIFMLFGDAVAFIPEAFGMTSLSFAVWLGLISVVCIKAVKYILFDPTKEQAYIPLDEESKVRGKAAVDGAGGRLGKTLGAILITFVYVPFFGNIVTAKGYIALGILIVLGIWILAVINLDVLFRKKVAEREAEAKEESDNTPKA